MQDPGAVVLFAPGVYNKLTWIPDCSCGTELKRSVTVMKKILALVLAFGLMTVILPAAAEDGGNLLTLFEVSGGEGDA